MLARRREHIDHLGVLRKETFVLDAGRDHRHVAGAHAGRSSPMRKSILPLIIHTICSCGCLWAAACAPALIFHHTIMLCLPDKTRRLILSVVRLFRQFRNFVETEMDGHARPAGFSRP